MDGTGHNTNIGILSKHLDHPSPIIKFIVAIIPVSRIGLESLPMAIFLNTVGSLGKVKIEKVKGVRSIELSSKVKAAQNESRAK